MIIAITGWKGSGKTTLVNRFVDGAEPAEKRGKVFIYGLPGGLTVVGRHPGSGGDLIDGTAGRELLTWATETYPLVLVESIKFVTPAWDGFWVEHGGIVGALDTPFEECIQRVYARREETGRNLGKPLGLIHDPKHDFPRTAKTISRLQALGVRSGWLDHRGDVAYGQVGALLKENGWVGRPGD
jgi:energy-coupling factor transporter ATP-binding protein EcfA2